MQLTARRILLSILIIAIIAVSAVLIQDFYSVPAFDFSPIQRDSPTLTQQEVAAIVNKHFRTIRRTRQLPQTIKESFTNLTGYAFDMSDPGGPMSTDLLIPGVSSRRFIFAGLADNAAVLVFEQGGYFNLEEVVVLSFADHKGTWAAGVNYGIRNIDGLRRAVLRREFAAVGFSVR